MSNPDTTLVRAFAALQSPVTTNATRSTAIGTVYTLAHPPLTRRCDALIAALAPAHWMAGEDLASATLLRLVTRPELAQACRSTTVDGILAFLRRAAFYHLLDTREARAEREIGVRGLFTERMDEAVLMLQPNVPVTDSAVEAAFWQRYRLAVRKLPSTEQRAWVLCVEQEQPMAEVARHLGLDRTTVWRQVRAAAVRLREALEPEFSRGYRHDSRLVAVEAPPRRRGR